jgi:hypothetical protein
LQCPTGPSDLSDSEKLRQNFAAVARSVPDESPDLSQESCLLFNE